jgi:hypothetical protein
MIPFADVGGSTMGIVIRSARIRTPPRTGST